MSTKAEMLLGKIAESNEAKDDADVTTVMKMFHDSLLRGQMALAKAEQKGMDRKAVNALKKAHSRFYDAVDKVASDMGKSITEFEEN